MFMRKSFRPGKGKEKGSRMAERTLRFDPTSPNLPVGFEKCIEFLEQHIKEPGIFRLSGSSSQLAELKAKLISMSADEAGRSKPAAAAATTTTSASGVRTSKKVAEGEDPSDISWYDPHVVSGCLKLFLREMDEPICTYELYDCWLSAVLPFREARVTCVRKLLTFLPLGHTVLLQRICCLLRKISQHADDNKMNASNLAIVFAPTFFRRAGESMQDMVADQKTTLALVEHLINDYEYIFEDKPIPATDDEPNSKQPADQQEDQQAAAAAAAAATPTTPRSQQNVNTGNKPVPAIALWDHGSLTGAELSFRAMELLLVEETDTDHPDFWFGSLMAQSASRGYFQKAFVQLLDPALRVGQAAVSHSFDAGQPELLSCSQGDLFIVEPTCAHDGWYEADQPLTGQHGLVPCSFVNIVWPAPPSADRPPVRRLNQLKQAGNFYKRLSRIDAGELARKMAEIGSKAQADDHDEPDHDDNDSGSVDSATTGDQEDGSQPVDDAEQPPAADQQSPVEQVQAADQQPPVEQVQAADTAQQPAAADDDQAPARVVALFRYVAETSPPELSFEKDDVMTVRNVQSSGWLEVELNGSVGLVPSTYVTYI